MELIKEAQPCAGAGLPGSGEPSTCSHFRRFPAAYEAPLKQSFPGPLAAEDPEAIDLLRAALDRAGFAEDGVRVALAEQTGRLQLKRIDFPLYARRLAAPGALHTLIRFFMMQLWLNPAEVAAALAPLSLDRLVALGLVERGSRGVHSRSALSLCDGLIIAHDRVEEEDDDPAADYVLGVNASAFTLANLTVRRPVERTLDLGAGGGIQALLASRHSRQVIATDTNPRALNYLVFNARLNDIKNIECRQGSLFEPVAGCRFDLITCNPPYVISPESQFIFRDSGLPGHQICAQVVREAADHLVEGGFASILCNWAHKRDEDWTLPVRRWVEHRGCDAWVLRGATEDPLSYAAAWTRTRKPDAYAQALDRWQQYYARLGIEALSMGAVILRRRADGAPAWFRAEDWPAKPTNSCSAHILRVFAAENCAAQSDEALLEQTFCLAPDHVLLQQLRFRNGELAAEHCQMQLEQGLRFKANLDVYSLSLVSRLDGRHTLAQAVAELSRSVGLPAEKLQSQAVAAVRQLLAAGFLDPVLAGPASPHRAARAAVDLPAEETAAGI